MADYRYYLGPWLWTDDGENPPGWRGPEGTRGLVDLATVGEQAENEAAAGSMRRIGFFATETELGAEYTLLGQGDCRELAITGWMRDAWESVCGYRPAGDWLVDLLWDQLTAGSDPVGGISVKPLLPTADRLELHLAGHSLVKRQLFDLSIHSHRGKVLDTMRQDFAELFDLAESGRLKDRDHPRRVLDYWCIQFGTPDWRQFVPPRLRAHVPGRLPHETSLSDNFDRTAANLNGSTASGGGTWTESEGGGWDTNGSAARTTGANADHAARLESDVSSSNHFCQFDITASTSGGRGGPTVRHSTSAETMYYLYCRADQNDFSWWKQVGGTHTQLGSNTAFTYTLPDTARLRASGSTIEAIFNGTSKGSVTDTAISGNLRGGLYSFVTNFYVDNWSAGDLSMAASAPAASMAVSGVVSGCRKFSISTPTTVSLAGVVPTTRKRFAITPVVLNVTPVIPLIRKTVAASPATLGWSAIRPFDGLIVQVQAALVSLSGVTAATLKRASALAAVMPLTSVIPGSRKHTAAEASTVGWNAVVPHTRKQSGVPTAQTTLSAISMATIKRSAILPFAIGLQLSPITSRKQVPFVPLALTLNPLGAFPLKRTMLSSAGITFAVLTPRTTKCGSALPAVLALSSILPASRKRTVPGVATVGLAGLAPIVTKASQLPIALFGCSAGTPNTRKQASVSVAAFNLWLPDPIIRKWTLVAPAELAFSARLRDQIQPWEIFRFGHRGTVFAYQAPGTVFRFGRRRTVFQFQDK